LEHEFDLHLSRLGAQCAARRPDTSCAIPSLEQILQRTNQLRIAERKPRILSRLRCHPFTNKQIIRQFA